MEFTDHQIKELLEQSQLNIEVELELEGDVMAQIESVASYESLLLRSKRRAKVGLRVCLFISFALVVSLLYNLINGPRLHQDLERMAPSAIVVVLLFLLYQLLHFSQHLDHPRIATSSR